MYQPIPKNEVIQQLGKGSFWFPKYLQGDVTYLNGVPSFDSTREEKPSDVPAPLALKVLPKGLKLGILHRFKNHEVGIPFSDIKAIELLIADDIITQQERSVLGRAAIGGLLLGPLGAVVGGMTGLQSGTKVEKPDMILTIAVERNGEQAFIVSAVKKKHQLTVERFLKKHLSSYLAVNSK